MARITEESLLSVVEWIGSRVGRLLGSDGLSPNAKLLALLAFWASLILNAFHPLVRFGHPAINYAFFAVAALTPLWMMLIACRKDGWRELAVKFLIASLFTPAFFFAVIGAGCGIRTVQDGGIDYSNERLRSERFRGGKILVYRTNGGATTSYAIVLRQECGIFPGVSIVRTLTTRYGTDVTLEPVGDGSIRARFPAYNVDGESVQIVRLRRGCWGPDI